MAELNSKKLANLTEEQLKAHLVDLGEDLDYGDLLSVRAEAESTVPLPVPPAERSQSSAYRWIVNASRIVTEALSILQVAVIQGILAPLMAIFLAYVEWDRARQGIAQFDTTHANLLAAVAVLAYVVLTVIQAHYSKQYQQIEQKERWTVRKGLRDLKNFLWGEPTYVTEADQIRGITNIIQILIVIAASFGSLQGQFEGETVSIQTVIATVQGDFRILTGVIIMSLLALSLLRGLHWSLFRVHEITVNLVGGVEVGDNRSFLYEQQNALAERERIGAEAQKMYLIKRILEKQRQLKSSPIPELTEPTSSLSASQTYSNGSGT